jgi:DnaJ family protein C protein 27
MGDRKKSVAPSTKSSAPSAKGVALPVNRIKILSIGPGGGGKSCLVKRYCEERFIAKYIATIGVDYGVKPVDIDGMNVKVNFWDLSGHQEFFEIRNEFYKDAQGILLVYDVTSRESFDELDGWLSEASKFGANIREVPVILCANKIDKRRVVTEDEGRQFASSRHLDYFETSASSGANVHEVFDALFRAILRKAR